MRLLAVALLAATTLACSKSKPAPTTPVIVDPPVATTDPAVDPAAPPPAATPSDAELEQMFADTLVFFEALGTAVDTNKADCAAMATAINGVLDQHEPLLRKAKTFEGNAEVDEKADAYMQAHEAQAKPAYQKLNGAQACENDAGVQAAFKRFDTM